jgi:phosphoglycolate phosphatase-like HAD superfamily hydrolase
VVIGDIGADVEAARAAGAQAILVPTPVTRAEEIAAAPEVAPDLAAAVDRILADRPAPRPRGGAPRDDVEVAA